jgi:hypothetical protein
MLPYMQRLFYGTPRGFRRPIREEKPHTDEALRRMSRVAVDIIRVLEGKKPVYPINRPRK